MNKQNNEEKIISLIKYTYKAVHPSPGIKDRMLFMLLQEAQPVSSPININNRVPVLASTMILIAVILIIYGYIAASLV
jgi:hypothetical protein